MAYDISVGNRQKKTIYIKRFEHRILPNGKPPEGTCPRCEHDLKFPNGLKLIYLMKGSDVIDIYSEQKLNCSECGARLEVEISGISTEDGNISHYIDFVYKRGIGRIRLPILKMKSPIGTQAQSI